MIMYTLCLWVLFTGFTFAAAFSQENSCISSRKMVFSVWLPPPHSYVLLLQGRGRIWPPLLMSQVNLVSWHHKSSHNKTKDSQSIKWILKSWRLKYSQVMLHQITSRDNVKWNQYKVERWVHHRRTHSHYSVKSMWIQRDAKLSSPFPCTGF